MNMNKNRNHIIELIYSTNILGTFILMLLLFVIIIFGSMFIQSSESNTDNENLHKYYTSITVSPKDTLWSLADTYNNGAEDHAAYIQNIRQLNNMKSDRIHYGEHILVYYYSEELK